MTAAWITGIATILVGGIGLFASRYGHKATPPSTMRQQAQGTGNTVVNVDQSQAGPATTSNIHVNTVEAIRAVREDEVARAKQAEATARIRREEEATLTKHAEEAAVAKQAISNYKQMLTDRQTFGIQLINERRAEINKGLLSKTEIGHRVEFVNVIDPLASMAELTAIENDYNSYFKRLFESCDSGNLQRAHDLAKEFVDKFPEERLKRVFSNQRSVQFRIKGGIRMVPPPPTTEYSAAMSRFLEGMQKLKDSGAP